jgi:hypothetical protein
MQSFISQASRATSFGAMDYPLQVSLGHRICRLEFAYTDSSVVQTLYNDPQYIWLNQTDVRWVINAAKSTICS